MINNSNLMRLTCVREKLDNLSLMINQDLYFIHAYFFRRNFVLTDLYKILFKWIKMFNLADEF